MREWDKKRRTMRHYDQQAKIYDVQYLEEQNAKIESALTSMEIKSNELILDIGCGTGFLFPNIRKAKLLVGIDTSLKALQVAKKWSNAHLIQADADNTPFPHNIFDKVFAITVMQNLPQPTKTIAEMKRTAKATAAFAVTGLKKKFTQKSFVVLLETAGLKVVTLNGSQQLKGYVAVCRNL